MHNKTKINTELPQTVGSILNYRPTTTEPPLYFSWKSFRRCYFVFSISVFTSGFMFLFTLGVILPGVISFYSSFFLPGIFSPFRLAYVFSFYRLALSRICTYIYSVKICVTTICVPPQTVFVGVMLFPCCPCIRVCVCPLRLFP